MIELVFIIRRSSVNSEKQFCLQIFSFINLKNKFMKSVIKSLSVIIFILLSLVGCKKDNSPDSSFTSYLRGKIDGVAFECTSNIFASRPYHETDFSNDVTIKGEWPLYSIHLFVHSGGSNITTGTYVFQSDKIHFAQISNYSAIYYFAGVHSTFYSPYSGLIGSGRITITEISYKNIRGTFEFVTDTNYITKLSKTVTDGEFYIKRGF